MKMKYLLNISLLLLTSFAWGQQNKFIGSYGYSIGNHSLGSGEILLYPTSDSTSIFRMDKSRGHPSYNSGALVGEIRIVNDTIGLFQSKHEAGVINCSLTFKITPSSLEVSYTNPNNDKCGFGFGVYPHDSYPLMSNNRPEQFITRSGKIIKFKGYDWHKWWTDFY